MKKKSNRKVREVKSNIATKLYQKMVIGGSVVSDNEDGTFWIERDEVGMDDKKFTFYEKVSYSGERLDMSFSRDTALGVE